MSSYVFISYSDQDKLVADAVCAALERDGLRCWIPWRDICPGEDWVAAMANAIDKCGAMVLILSHNANQSINVARDVERAIGRGVVIIPLRVENVLPSGSLASYLNSAHWLDAFPPPVDQYFDRLANALKGILSRMHAHTPRDEAVPRARETLPPAPPSPNVRLPEPGRSLSDGELLLAARARRMAKRIREEPYYREPYSPAPPRAHAYPDPPAPRPERARGAPPSNTLPFVVGMIGGAALALAAGALVFRHEIGAFLGWLTQTVFHTSMTPTPGMAATGETLLDVSAYAPPRARRGSRFLVQIFLYDTDDDPSTINAAAEAADASATRRGVATLEVEIARSERLDIALSGSGVEIDQPLQSLIWRGRSRSCSFEVRVPENYAESAALLTVRVFRAAVPIGQLRFSVAIETIAAAARPQPTGDEAKRYRRAFLSYASADRAEVIKRAQALRAAQITFFNDLLSLEPGEEWETRLYQEIESCDLFLLFWSHAARESVWVKKEIDHALACERRDSNGSPEILPILLEGPPPAPPPATLADRHFNDPLLYVIAALDKLSAAHPAL